LYLALQNRNIYMKITFHGAARTVTGSKHLITLNNSTKILMDCGMFQGMGDDTEDMNEDLGFNSSEITYLVLSHAHIDHCGLIPLLVANGFKGPIFCTPPTMELTKILLEDSAKIQIQDNEYINKHRARKGLPLQKSLYTEDDVITALSLFKIVNYNEDYQIDEYIKLKFTDAGHIIGSAAINLTILEDDKENHITFSGDVGRYGDAILKSPQPFPQAEYILLESTYGDSLHKEIEPTEGLLLEVINQTCLIKGGKVIIPAFSVGRTQEILFALNGLEEKGELPDINYYVDSPLSIKATQILQHHPEVYNNSVKELMKTDHDVFNFKGLTFIESVIESKALNADNRPCVIIASSGMADAGRVKHHIKNCIENQKNTILMVGYCEPKSLGGRLMAGNTEVSIFGEKYLVKAEVQSIKSMSAHGDYNDLIRFLSCQNTEKIKKIFLVHGEYDTQQNFRDKLMKVGYKAVEIPYRHQTIEI
jgi:metallo-beta-lactamase family protein